MNERPSLHCEPAYENSYLVARDLHQRIGELLRQLPAINEGRAMHWRHVGDLATINHQLASIIALLEGRN